MKKIIILLIMFSFCTLSHAQETHKPGIRPFSEFAPDTIAYLKANWGGSFQGDYTGYPIKHVLEDLDLRVVSLHIFKRTGFRVVDRLGLSFQTAEEFEKEFQRPLTVTLDPVLRPKDGQIFEKLQEGQEGLNIIPFNQDVEKLIENLTVNVVHY